MRFKVWIFFCRTLCSRRISWLTQIGHDQRVFGERCARGEFLNQTRLSRDLGGSCRTRGGFAGKGELLRVWAFPSKQRKSLEIWGIFAKPSAQRGFPGFPRDLGDLAKMLCMEGVLWSNTNHSRFGCFGKNPLAGGGFRIEELLERVQWRATRMITESQHGRGWQGPLWVI